MRVFRGLVASGLVGVLTLAGALLLRPRSRSRRSTSAAARCVKGVAAALKDVDGVKGVCDAEGRHSDPDGHRRRSRAEALDALAAAGYHGDSGNATLLIKKESNVPGGKVKSITLSNLHNCCGRCAQTIKSTVKSVDGVTGDTVKAKTANFQVTGDFDAAKVVEA